MLFIDLQFLLKGGKFFAIYGDRAVTNYDRNKSVEDIMSKYLVERGIVYSPPGSVVRGKNTGTLFLYFYWVRYHKSPIKN